MEQKKTNQERGRKRLRSKTKALDENQPSKAPGQDQNPGELLGSSDFDRGATQADGGSPGQGISNRPANEEHAFANPHPPRERDVADPTVPRQQGGNRGGV